MWRFIPVWLVVAIMAVGASAIGSGVVQPAPAHAQTTFDVDLGVGWNLVSSLGEAAGVEEALGAAAGAVRSVNTYDARNQNFETFTAGGPALLNSLGTIPTGAGVWLLAEQAVTWSQPRLDGARSVPLLTGFNLVAWTGSDNTPIAGAVAALGGALESIFLWEARAERYLTFRPAAEAFLNSAEVLNYGDGLWALMNAPATWEQPAASAPTDGVDEPCMGDDYDRDEWGGYPPAPANAAPTWTKPHDAVHSRAITHDHHVALRDAHVSGGCDWSAAMKDRFSSDLANLNPTTLSFNASKGSRTPDQLTGIAARIIDTAAEQCVYARQHRAVKQEWGLTQTSTEQATITVWLVGCGTTNGSVRSQTTGPLFASRSPATWRGLLVDCPHCDSGETSRRRRRTALGSRTSACRACRRTFNERTVTPFNDLQYPTDIVLLAVLWRLRYTRSFRDVVALLLERGFGVTHETIRNWECRCASLWADRLRAKRRGCAGVSWSIDETDVKVAGRGCSLYRASDRDGDLLDSMRSEHRDKHGARRFLRRLVDVAQRKPERVTTDPQPPYRRAIRWILGRKVRHRCSQYLHTLAEQSHRAIKQRDDPMLGFGSFASAARFCSAFDELRHDFRARQRRGQSVPLAEQRRLFVTRWRSLIAEMQAA